MLHSATEFDWTKSSKLYADFEVETYFSAWSFTHAEYLQTHFVPKGRLKSAPVELPKLPFEPNCHNGVPASQLIGNEEVYGNYLRAIIEQAYLDCKPFAMISQHFLCDVVITSARDLLEFYIPFVYRMHTPNYDSLASRILAGNTGKFIDYEYQDGVVEGIIKNNHIHFLDAPYGYKGKYELDDGFYNICFPLKDYQSKIIADQNNVRSLLKKLTEKIGVDVWTTHPKKTPHFKAGDWHTKRPFGIDERYKCKRNMRNFMSKYF